MENIETKYIILGLIVSFVFSVLINVFYVEKREGETALILKKYIDTVMVGTALPERTLASEEPPAELEIADCDSELGGLCKAESSPCWTEEGELGRCVGRIDIKSDEASCACEK